MYKKNRRYACDTQAPFEQLLETHGEEALELVLLVYINFYFSELEIMDLCSRWVPKRTDFTEKSYLVKHAHDELIHAKLFREGVERLGLDWDALDHERYRIQDICDRFEKLLDSDDELEVMIGLNVYAEGVLALEEIYQLSQTRPDIFYEFERIYKDEMTHLRFGMVVLKRQIESSPALREQAFEHCRWYEQHLNGYLSGELLDKIQKAIDMGFIQENYIESTKQRFRAVMAEIGYQSTI